MPVTAPETTAINLPDGAPSLPEDPRRSSLPPLSYDFRLFALRPDEDPLTTARRPPANGGANNAQAARKDQIADALFARLPTLQVYQFPYHQIATFERISPEQARDKYRQVELNSPDGGNGLIITLRDNEASVSLPFWHESGRAKHAIEEAWLCLETISRMTGYLVYDPQMERMLNLETDAPCALAFYTGLVNRLREDHSGPPVQKNPPHDIAIRELAKPQGGGAVLLAVSDGDAVCGFAEISVDSTPVNGSPSRAVATLTGWYIQPAFRDRGIDRRLLESAQEWTMAHRLGDLTNPFDSRAGAAAATAHLPELSPATVTASS